MNGLLVALLIWGFGGLANLFIDIPALWNHNWANGSPSYQDLVRAQHRHLHTPFFCLLVSSIVWVCLIALTYGLRLGQILLSQGGKIIMGIYGLVLYLRVRHK